MRGGERFELERTGGLLAALDEWLVVVVHVQSGGLPLSGKTRHPPPPPPFFSILNGDALLTFRPLSPVCR